MTELSLLESDADDSPLIETTPPDTHQSIYRPSTLPLMEIERGENPEERNNFCSNLWYCFYVDLDKTEVVTKKTTDYFRPNYLVFRDQLDSYNRDKQDLIKAKKLKKPSKPSLCMAILKTVWGCEFLVAFICMFVGIAFYQLEPIWMRNIMRSTANRRIYAETEGRQGSNAFPWFSIIFECLSPILRSLINGLGNRYFYHSSSQIRSSMVGSLFQKTLQLNLAGQGNVDTGRIVTMISSDAKTICENFPSAIRSVSLPVHILVPFFFLLNSFGVSTFMALAVITAVIPFQIICAVLVGLSLRKYLQHNDNRMKLTNEVIGGIRAVKFSGLEEVFIERIEAARHDQINDITVYTFASSTIGAFFISLAPLINVATFGVFIKTKSLSQDDFSIVVIPNLSLMNLLMQPLTMWPLMLLGVSVLFISLNRVRDFLLLPEIKIQPHEAITDEALAIDIQRAYFKWADPPEVPVSFQEKAFGMAAKLLKKKDDPNAPSDPEVDHFNSLPDQALPSPSISPSSIFSLSSLTEDSEDDTLPGEKLTLRNINITLPKGSLTMVVGPVGCGKSSLGSAIIGEIERVAGKVKVEGKIAFCPQQPWIINDTVKNNILLATPYDKQRYDEVVRVCELDQDFQTFAAGDSTMIGEKGVSISGGQKARIQLARAVYSDRDILILDDPLSAVDAHVGRALMDECILTFLKGKTVLLLTNQIQYLDKADKILCINHGAIVAQGTYDELKEKGIDLDNFIIRRKDKHAHRRKKSVSAKTEEKKEENDAAKEMMSDEEMSTKSIPFSVYRQYIRTLMPKWAYVPFFAYVSLTAAMTGLCVYWLGVIGDKTQFKSMTFAWKIGVYGFFAIGQVVLLIVRGIFGTFQVRRSVKSIHGKLLDSIIHAPISFFDTTPQGRILNRFTSDITQVDQTLYSQLITSIHILLCFFGYVIIICISSPLFVIPGLVAVTAVFLIIRFYSPTIRNLQRMNNTAQSPVLSIFSEVINGAGLSTLRTYNLEKRWTNRFYKSNDIWSIRYCLSREGEMFADVYVGIIAVAFSTCVVLFGWNRLDANKMGVSLTAALQFYEIGCRLVQEIVGTDAKMTNFERVMTYTNDIPQEKRSITFSFSFNQPKWPSEGRVVFKDVKMRYRPGLPFVLRGVNFEVKGGEKIGVCGRTGAGKSSLLYALFRLVELESYPGDRATDDPNSGEVLIDGVNIAKMDLSKVRQSIAIIPQDPTLFTGSVRYNLDLAGKRTDDEIYAVIDMVEMRDVIGSLPKRLDSEVSEGGSNFSAGQRQLLCFARAILNRCKIVVLDEATASVDVETDEKIQKTIREQFKEQTVIVIAHRLNTIMDLDRILVMEHGKVAEYDTPDNLKANPDSALNALIGSLDH
ncbi:Multidrug resistance-associated protein [Blattamonas nauphoetae]|uniref:Multidrug resistance-associated protein n=1 Tax=Blattamonas nauphoetae TaxID=2049346 RepID=A0ABQ9XHN4_9EUKA|nr:Multidrug resistance-associated protein [Blattamonas nauphoetae]